MEKVPKPFSSQIASSRKNIEDKDYITEYVQSISGEVSKRKFKKCGSLGTGGFANCFIVENTQTKKRAAAKVISKEVLTSYRTKLRVKFLLI